MPCNTGVCSAAFNEELVQLLLIRDELHVEQDAMLVDIEDLTRSVCLCAFLPSLSSLCICLSLSHCLSLSSFALSFCLSFCTLVSLPMSFYYVLVSVSLSSVYLSLCLGVSFCQFVYELHGCLIFRGLFICQVCLSVCLMSVCMCTFESALVKLQIGPHLVFIVAFCFL